ncbi:hypothetical protein HYH03_017356 [Edaphochlamys debaryana]|uniref:Uncharacterized protein n=1 Tax=Edaphochlamys debaryana TaxID=47281 RepID=A0A835XJA4_9CHLO|nr:hypothetical protein HYH03_017356 [Edaphochlamys debaryana]|eukprot:KAG2483833.1 hypothetical protein HYH03_017356 [Edaphochlamys debaryana]
MENAGVSVRDARRVVQVLVPGVPPPILDFAFASMAMASRNSLASSAKRPGIAPSLTTSSRVVLRRCESGEMGEPSLLELASINAGSGSASMEPMHWNWNPSPAKKHGDRRR